MHITTTSLMYKYLFTLFLFLFLSAEGRAQFNNNFNEITPDGNITDANGRRDRRNVDSLGTDKEVPVGLRVWTIDSKLGFTYKAKPDTLPYMYMNTIFTEGLHGEYNTTGNVGSPRLHRIFIDRKQPSQFVFTDPYDFFITPIEDFHFTNTLSPFTNVSYNTCGDRTEGEDHIVAKFGINAGKRLGMGMKFDYIYGRGFYESQSTSLFNYTFFGSYLGDRYQAHLILSTNHMKVAENGGVTDDNYITHPESFSEEFEPSEVPVSLRKNWNRNNNQHAYLTHRYNIGFNRKVPMMPEEIEARKFALAAKMDAERRKRTLDKDNMQEGERHGNQPQESLSGRPDDAHIVGLDEQHSDTTLSNRRITVASKEMADSLIAIQNKEMVDTSWTKDEYVPVTSFIHTIGFDNYKRLYLASQSPENYYHSTFPIGDLDDDENRIIDKTKHYALNNTFALSLLEGFNKWAKAGLNLFLTSEIRHFELPDSIGFQKNSYNEHNLSIGGQLIKHNGRTLHYEAGIETWLTGKDAGQTKIDIKTDVNFKFLGDTITLAAKAFLYRLNPTFYYRHYHSRHFWWDHDDMNKIIHSRVEGLFSYKKTKTILRIAVDELKNFTYWGQSCILNSNNERNNYFVSARQCNDAINLITLSLRQDFKLGPLNWENVITYQKSSKSEILSVPKLNLYSNLYFRFKIAKVLSCDAGTDLRYFTKYYAPEYCPYIGQYAVQEQAEKVETGNYPFLNIYANFHLKRTRFFVMMSHINSDFGKKNYFVTPHYPVNPRTLRFGLSWNFIN